MHIKTPSEILKTYDESLIDNVFNPIAWKIESRFGVKSASLAYSSLYVGFILGTVLGLIFGIPAVNFAAFMVGCTLMHNTLKKFEQMRGNNGGNVRNRLRLFWFVRVGFQSALLALGAVAFIVHADDGYVILVLSSCFLTLVIPHYFMTCDKIPPMFTQEQAVPQSA